MRRAFVFAVLTLAACGGPNERANRARDPQPLDETCRATIAPRERPSPGAPRPAPVVPRSRIIADVDLRLASLANELDARAPRRVAEERGRDIGVAGALNVTVDRGPFTTSVEGEALLVRTELRGHAEACAKGRCYAACDPVAVATAVVPLRLTPEWRFAPSRVTVAFTRGCQVRVLGGFVRIDVTPTLAAQLGPALRRVEREIDGQLPQPRPRAEQLWKELSEVRPMPLGGCVIVQPRAIVQGPMTGSNAALRARFALEANPEIRARCGEPPARSPLPPLGYDPGLPAEDGLVVASVAPLSRAMSALASSEPFDVDGARVRIMSASAAAAGAELDLDLALRGEACGNLLLRTSPQWSEDGRSIRFASPELASHPGVAPVLAPAALGELIPQLVSSIDAPAAVVKAAVHEVKPLAAYARDDDLVTTIRVRGNVEIVQK